MSGSSSRRPRTRSISRENLVLRRKQSIQHRHIHDIYQYPEPAYLNQYPDDSCDRCYPITETISRGFQGIIRVVTQYDPQLTISGRNHRTYIAHRFNFTRAVLADVLSTFTFWKIPANFALLAQAVLQQNFNTRIESISDLTQDEEDQYITEVNQFLLDALSEDRRVSDLSTHQYPPTPYANTYTPLQFGLNQGSQLIADTEDLFNSILIEEYEDENSRR